MLFSIVKVILDRKIYVDKVFEAYSGNQKYCWSKLEVDTRFIEINVLDLVRTGSQIVHLVPPRSGFNDFKHFWKTGSTSSKNRKYVQSKPEVDTRFIKMRVIDSVGRGTMIVHLLQLNGGDGDFKYFRSKSNLTSNIIFKSKT